MMEKRACLRSGAVYLPTWCVPGRRDVLVLPMAPWRSDHDRFVAWCFENGCQLLPQGPRPVRGDYASQHSAASCQHGSQEGMQGNRAGVVHSQRRRNAATSHNDQQSKREGSSGWRARGGAAAKGVSGVRGNVRAWVARLGLAGRQAAGRPEVSSVWLNVPRT